MSDGHADITSADPDTGGDADRSEPFFALHAFVCCNRRPDGHARGSCAARGSEKLRDYMKARAKELGIPSSRINSAGCLDRCELGPCLVIYPAGSWFRIESPADIDRVLAAWQSGGDEADSLRLRNDQTPH